MKHEQLTDGQRWYLSLNFAICFGVFMLLAFAFGIVATVVETGSVLQVVLLVITIACIVTTVVCLFLSHWVIRRQKT